MNASQNPKSMMQSDYFNGSCIEKIPLKSFVTNKQISVELQRCHLTLSHVRDGKSFNFLAQVQKIYRGCKVYLIILNQWVKFEALRFYIRFSFHGYHSVITTLQQGIMMCLGSSKLHHTTNTSTDVLLATHQQKLAYILFYGCC